jgi:hypothetical protein
MASSTAANGRNAVALAPSLPEHSLGAASAQQPSVIPEGPEQVAALVSGLSLPVAELLDKVAASVPGRGDRDARQHAARSVRDICSLLSRAGP